MGKATMPMIIRENGILSVFWSFSRKIIRANKIENIISPLLRTDALRAVELRKPKKYVINAELSAIPISNRRTKSLFLISLIEPLFLASGEKNSPLIIKIKNETVTGF